MTQLAQADPSRTRQAQSLELILTRRQQRLNSILSAEEGLGRITDALTGLERRRLELLGTLRNDAALERLQELSQDNLRATLVAESAQLAKLRTRFSRSTINIGVIGRARQGKSKLLQSITGLSRREIPDGSGSHCTGVRSTIIHSDEVEPHGLVQFHNETSFLQDVLSPYYADLSLGRPPQSLDEFATRQLPPLPKELKDSTVAQAKYEHLSTYHVKHPAYRALIGRPTRRITLDQVRSYVAQDDEQGNRIYVNYLAVREVQLFCRFPQVAAAHSGVIDMPGLGDTGVGDQDRLVSVLGHDVDAVVIVKLPSATGDYWADQDVALFDLARRALTDLPLEKWSFVVLNRTRPSGDAIGSNEQNCRHLVESAPSKHISVTGMVIADCTDADEVQGKVFARIVDYLREHGSHLDDEYATATQQRLDHLLGDVTQYLAEAEACLGSSGSTEREFTTFDALFDDMWSSLTNRLEDLAAQFRAKATEPHVELAREVDAAVERARHNVVLPSLEDIERLARRHGAYTSAFNSLLHLMRTRVSDEFQPLEDALRLSLEDVRDRVARVLRDECGLASLSARNGSAFLGDIKGMLPSESAQLKEAITILSSVDLTYRGFLQYRLRPHLMVLHPDGAAGQEQVRVSASAQSVQEGLELLHERAVYRIEEAFEPWLNEPNQVAAAVVEEFVDRVLRAEDAKPAWRNFYLEHRARVWETQFDELGEGTRARQLWGNEIQGVRSAAGAPLVVLSR